MTNTTLKTAVKPAVTTTEGEESEMNIRVLDDGYMTTTEKKHVKFMLSKGVMSGKIKRTIYEISKEKDCYRVAVTRNERNCIGADLKPATYHHKFRIV